VLAFVYFETFYFVMDTQSQRSMTFGEGIFTSQITCKKFCILKFSFIVIVSETVYADIQEELYHRNYRDCYCVMAAFILIVLYMLARRVGTDFGWISPPFLVRQRAFGRSAFINGNNGEATNSDDVQRSELFVDLELEFQHVSDFYLLTPQTPMLNRADDELTIFSLLCGAIISLTERNHTKQELINCMNLTLMCIVEEEFSTLDYTELLYDLFIHRNKLVRTLKRELGPEMVSFMNYDIELLVDCLGSSPRESQLRSSHGEITEGDDMSSTGPETSVKGQFVDLSYCVITIIMEIVLRLLMTR